MKNSLAYLQEATEGHVEERIHVEVGSVEGQPIVYHGNTRELGHDKKAGQSQTWGPENGD